MRSNAVLNAAFGIRADLIGIIVARRRFESAQPRVSD
jgi:hypothetical protein